MRKYLFVVLILASAVFNSVAAYAADRIMIGIIPEVNLAKQMERFTPLCMYIGRHLGMEVGVKPLANYGLIYEEMRDGKIDAGFFGSFVYGLTHARIGIEPIARPVRSDGVSTYTGYTIVRKDSGIKSAQDMKGKTIALVDPATTAGYLAQRAYLKKGGLDIDRDLKIFWASSHDAAAMAVFNKRADIAGAKDSPIKKLMKENSVFKDAVTVLDETPNPPVPDNTFAVIKGMKPELKEKIRKALLSMDKDPEGKQVLEKFGAAGFVETHDKDYKSLYDLVKYLGIDMKTYSYKKQ